MAFTDLPGKAMKRERLPVQWDCIQPPKCSEETVSAASRTSICFREIDPRLPDLVGLAGSFKSHARFGDQGLGCSRNTISHLELAACKEGMGRALAPNRVAIPSAV
jgi:hypothetical protein